MGLASVISRVRGHSLLIWGLIRLSLSNSGHRYLITFHDIAGQIILWFLGRDIVIFSSSAKNYNVFQKRPSDGSPLPTLCSEKFFVHIWSDIKLFKTLSDSFRNTILEGRNRLTNGFLTLWNLANIKFRSGCGCADQS